MISGINPFKNGKSRVEMLAYITEQDPPMLPVFSPDARNLLGMLLQRDPIARIGVTKI